MSNKVRVNVEFTTDKSKNPLTTSEFIKHGNQWLSEAMNAATALVNSKADKTYVDTELAKKAEASAVAQLQQTINTKADSTTISAVSDRVSEVKTEQATLSARMDEFTRLEEGSTTGDAELIDGRVGADGKTYDNIGGAIRSQVTDLKNDLKTEYVAVNFKMYKGTFVPDYTPDVNLAMSDHILFLEKGTHIYLKNKDTTTYQFKLNKYHEDYKIYGKKIGETEWSKDTIVSETGWYAIAGNRSTGEDFGTPKTLNDNVRIVRTATTEPNAQQFERVKLLANTTWSGSSGQKLFKSFGRYSSDRFYEITGDVIYAVSNKGFKIVFFDENFEFCGSSGDIYYDYYRTEMTFFPAAKYFVINGPEETGLDVDAIDIVLGDNIKVNEISNNVTVSHKDGADFVIKGTDARPALQQAIWLAYVRGQKVLLSEGDYVLESIYDYGATVSGDKACIILNQTETDSQYFNTAKFFTIEGAVQPLGYESGVRIILSDELYNSLKSEEKLSIVRSSFKEDIDVKKGTSAVALKNLIFILPMNGKKITCVDLSYSHACDIDSVYCMAGKPSLKWGAYNPPPIAVNECYGIRGLMGSNWGVQNTFRNIEAFGFYIGIDISGEHCSVINASAKYNYYGFTFCHLQRYGANHHPITCINLLDEHSVCMPIFGREGIELGQGVIIHGYNLMWPSWSSQGDITADDVRHHKAIEIGSSTGNGFGGEIWYNNNTLRNGAISSNQPFPAFFESGGKAIKCVNVAHKLRYSTEGRLSIEPNFMQQVFDMTLNKLVLWDGEKWIDTLGNNVD